MLHHCVSTSDKEERGTAAALSLHGSTAGTAIILGFMDASTDRLVIG